MQKSTKVENSIELSNTIYVARAIAIFTVVCAHCQVCTDNNVLAYIAHVMNNMGTLGVPVFMFCSGLYCRCDVKPGEFIRNKVCRIIVPWMVAGTVTWAIQLIKGDECSIISWADWILGNGSIFYFLTDLLMIQVLHYLVQKIDHRGIVTIVVALVVSQIAIIAESKGIGIFATPYLNFLIFWGYFELGILIARNKQLFVTMLDNKYSVCLLLSIPVLFCQIELSYYAHWYALIFGVLFVFAIIKLASYCKPSKVVKDIGRNTLFIYLWHLIPISVWNYLGKKFSGIWILSVLWPMIIVLVMYWCMVLIRGISRKGWIETLLGIQENG